MGQHKSCGCHCIYYFVGRNRPQSESCTEIEMKANNYNKPLKSNSSHCKYLPIIFLTALLMIELYYIFDNLLCAGNREHIEWVHRRNGNVPDKAVEGGRDGSGEVYYIGRHSHHGDTIPGKIQKSHDCLYIGYGGKEIVKKEYGVLVKE